MSNKTKYEFSFKGQNYYSSSADHVELSSGVYCFELWGCSSGKTVVYQASGGAYVKGYLWLKEKKIFHIHVCSQGQEKMQFYAYGGGGPGQFGGGGATDVRLIDGEYDDYESLKSRIIVAAGAGAPDSLDWGGAGGGLNGYNSRDNHGKGGTQTSGGEGYYPGEFGLGGGNGTNIESAGNGGGGSGYYGGGTSESPSDYGGGGGSSFISGHNGCISIDHNGNPKSEGDVSIHYSKLRFYGTEMRDGKSSIISPDGKQEDTGHYGNGFVRITFIKHISNVLSCNDDAYFSLRRSRHMDIITLVSYSNF